MPVGDPGRRERRLGCAPQRIVFNLDFEHDWTR
jgi:hypothetical protein